MSNEKYGGFWIRLVAYIIDAIILGVIFSVVVTPIIGALGFGAAGTILDGGQMDDEGILALFSVIAGAGLVMQVVNFAIGLLYFGLLESSSKQASIGKMALGLKVVGKDGNAVSFATAALRYVGS